MEVVALTAFEARALKDLRSPSRIIAYLIFYVYFAYTLSETLNIDWINEQLGAAFQTPAPAGAKDIKTGPVLFLAANQVGSYAMGYFFIGCLIFAALSGSNTALYVASRAMYGMTRTWRDERTWLGRRAKWLSRETKKGVPLWSVIVSGVCFWWIPLSQLVDNNSTEDVGPLAWMRPDTNVLSAHRRYECS